MMSKLKEWLSLIPEGIKNAPQIVEGIVNNVKLNNGLLSEEEQEEIVRRRLLCMACPFMSANAKTSEEYFKLKGKHYETDREDDHCTLCGCPITTKTSCLSCYCGAKSFNDDHKTDLPIKFTPYVRTTNETN